MPGQKLLLLGPVRLETAEGRAVVGIGPKGWALLAYLAAHPDVRAERNRLAALLWDGDQAQARHALRQTLLVLRRRLGTCVVQNEGSTLVLNLDSINVDLRGFEAGIRGSDDAGLVSACSLWRGRFCDGLDVGAEGFEEWLGIERARLDDRAADAFRRLMQNQAESGNIDAALESAQRLVRLSPYDDNAHAMLIGLYRRRGWVGPARVAYRRCVKLFQQELGVLPSGEIDAAMRIPIEPGPIGAAPDVASACTAAVARPPLQQPPQQHARDRPWTSGALALLGMVIAAAIVIGERSVIDHLFGDAPPASHGWARVEPKVPDSLASAGASSAVPPVPNDFRNTSAVTATDEINRAIGLDPRYAHLYPAGC